GADGTDQLGVHAAGLVAGLADLAGVVAGEERADDELPGLDGVDVAADLLDDADVLVPHRGWPVDRLDAAVGPQVGAAHAGGGEADDRVGGLFDRRVVAVLDADIARGVEDDSSHGGSFRWVRSVVSRRVEPEAAGQLRRKTCLAMAIAENAFGHPA